MEGARGLDLPERVRHSIAAAVADRGVQARVISTQGRDSMLRPPQALQGPYSPKCLERLSGKSRGCDGGLRSALWRAGDTPRICPMTNGVA
jgi:hypothetical protein